MMTKHLSRPQLYKHVVHSIERFVHKSPPEFKLAGIYVIDAVVRQSQHKLKEKDPYAPRFAKNLADVFGVAFSTSPPKDKVRMFTHPPGI